MDVTELCRQSSHSDDPLLLASELHTARQPSFDNDHLPQLPPIDGSRLPLDNRPRLQDPLLDNGNTDSGHDFIKLPPIASCPPSQSIASPMQHDQEPRESSATMGEAIDRCASIYDELVQLKLTCTTKFQNQCKHRIDEISRSTGQLLHLLHAVEIQQQRTAKLLSGLVNDDNVSEMPIQKLTVELTPSSSDNALIRQARNLQDTKSPQSYRRRAKRMMVGQRCHSCHTTETPEWRRGPDGARTLCNACGLHYSKLLKKGSLAVQTHPAAITQTTKINMTSAHLLGHSSFSICSNTRLTLQPDD